MKKFFVILFAVMIVAFPVRQSLAQDVNDGRDASFLPSSRVPNGGERNLPVVITPPAPAFSGERQPTSSVEPSVSVGADSIVVAPSNTVVKSASSIEAASLSNIDPDAAGVLTSKNGGLGSSMWQDTPRALVDRLLPEVNLPTASPTLNNLARRLLLTIAQVPNGKSALTRSLTALRVEKLVALGDGPEAWQMANLVKPEMIDDITLRMTVEALLVNGDTKTACDIVPSMMSSHNSLEWQKLLIICQLQAGDTKAAQLGVDLMREQTGRDDIFIGLINKNIINTSKQLPRQLTPLKASNLVLLLQTGLPLPTEVFARPDAILVPQLIKAKAADDGALLALAEKAAARGLISSSDLAGVYAGISFKDEAIANAKSSMETGAKLRALTFQALSKEADVKKRLELAVNFIQSADAVALSGTVGTTLAGVVKNIPAQAEYVSYAGAMSRLFTLAGVQESAASWIKLARSNSSVSFFEDATMRNLWPVMVTSGLVDDATYGKELPLWLDASLKDADRAKRQLAGHALLLFSAEGISVSDDAWARVVDVSADNKRINPPAALLMERLRQAGTSNRKAEAALLSLLVADSGAAETPVLVLAEAVRALRLVGLAAEAQGLARETAAVLFAQAAP
ncbi:MAG: hypothetical protein PHX43_07675 [Alphaproteobacteria bacterium]|nr:hypothetical protein [Alphaproteobacteria bacterium]